MNKEIRTLSDLESDGVIIKLPANYTDVGVRKINGIDPDVFTSEFPIEGHVVTFEFTNLPPENEIIYALEVKFGFDHIERANSARIPLQLGVNHTGNPKDWKNKTIDALKQGINSNEWLGYFTVFIKGTTDPMVAWGP